MKKITLLVAALFLAGCGSDDPPAPEPETTAADTMPAESPEPAMPEADDEESLEDILAAQPEDVQARYEYRQPAETLRFFDIEPGMTVVEALPGGGWYTKILLPYLGEDGRLIGADYPYALWEANPNTPPERLEQKKTWVEDWTSEAETWRDSDDASIAAFQMGEMPSEMEGTADAVLFIRALHNLARWEDEADTLTMALTDAYEVLKPGGIVGIIQHEARSEKSDEWADGSRGYLKRDFVISRMEEAGFELVDSSDMHANEQDQPGEDDVVWRLPPTLAGSREDPEQAESMRAIGESNRMTLKFRKPDA